MPSLHPVDIKKYSLVTTEASAHVIVCRHKLGQGWDPMRRLEACSTHNTERLESEAEGFTDILGRAFGEQAISCGSRLGSLALALRTLIIIIAITVTVTVIA